MGAEVGDSGSRIADLGWVLRDFGAWSRHLVCVELVSPPPGISHREQRPAAVLYPHHLVPIHHPVVHHRKLRARRGERDCAPRKLLVRYDLEQDSVRGHWSPPPGTVHLVHCTLTHQTILSVSSSVISTGCESPAPSFRVMHTAKAPGRMAAGKSTGLVCRRSVVSELEPQRHTHTLGYPRNLP